MKVLVHDGETLLVGRGKVGLRIGDPAMSQKHLKIVCAEKKACTAEDLESTNGTLLNGEKILKSVVEPGDKLAVSGETLLVGET